MNLFPMRRSSTPKLADYLPGSFRSRRPSVVQRRKPAASTTRLVLERLEDRLAPAASLVGDINLQASSEGSGPSKLTNVNGIVYFRAADAVHGQELWKSDG